MGALDKLRLLVDVVGLTLAFCLACFAQVGQDGVEGELADLDGFGGNWVLC